MHGAAERTRPPGTASAQQGAGARDAGARHSESLVVRRRSRWPRSSVPSSVRRPTAVGYGSTCTPRRSADWRESDSPAPRALQPGKDRQNVGHHYVGAIGTDLCPTIDKFPAGHPCPRARARASHAPRPRRVAPRWGTGRPRSGPERAPIAHLAPCLLTIMGKGRGTHSGYRALRASRTVSRVDGRRRTTPRYGELRRSRPTHVLWLSVR